MDVSVSTALVVVLGLQLKHIVCDGPLQTLQMVCDKSHYGKLQGLLHALIHIAGTALIFAIAGLPIALLFGLSLLDGVVHYHIDFIKENVVKRLGWTNTQSQFWWALTTDQALHHMTYVALVWLAFKP